MKQIYCGVDTIELRLKDTSGICDLERDKYDFVNDSKGEVYATLKRGCTEGKSYRLIIRLPIAAGRQNNTKPFDIVDCVHLLQISNMLLNDLSNLFGGTLPVFVVSTVEVGATALLTEKKNIEPLMNMLAHMFLSNYDKVMLTCHGKKDGVKHKNLYSLCSGMQTESFKTERLGNKRFSVKCYNKGLEQNINDRGLFRIEFIYNNYGVEQAGSGTTLNAFLTVESLTNMIKCFRKDYDTYVLDLLWRCRDKNGKCHYFFKDVENAILWNLSKKASPLDAARMNAQYIEWDLAFMKRALERYYSNPTSVRTAINRIKRSGEFVINEGVVEEFIAISKSIVS